jgi:2-methylisocitrate lyase-like PEP mutase family enzyme
MGFRLAIYANMVLRSSVKAIQKSLAHLCAAGDSEGILDEMITMEERARITQKDKLDALEKRYVSAA